MFTCSIEQNYWSTFCLIFLFTIEKDVTLHIICVWSIKLWLTMIFRHEVIFTVVSHIYGLDLQFLLFKGTMKRGFFDNKTLHNNGNITNPSGLVFINLNQSWHSRAERIIWTILLYSFYIHKIQNNNFFFNFFACKKMVLDNLWLAENNIPSFHHFELT